MSNYSMYNIPEVAVPVKDGAGFGEDLAELLQILGQGLFDATTVPEVIVPAKERVVIGKDLAELLQILGYGLVDATTVPEVIFLWRTEVNQKGFWLSSSGY